MEGWETTPFQPKTDKENTLMKMTLCIFLALLTFVTLAFAQDSFAQDTSPERTVRAIYFVPNDRTPQPDIDAKLDMMLKEVQQFYADQMENHGFGRKKFKLETDTTEKVIVHHIVGKFNDEYYLDGVFDKVAIEIRDKGFDTSKNIYYTAIDISSKFLNDEGRVAGQGVHDGNMGGLAVTPASGTFFDAPLTAHEIGHTFGLLHDFRRTITDIMSHGPWPWGQGMQLSQCAAEWLDAHPYFNASKAASNNNTEVQMLAPTLAAPPATIRLQFEITDPDGLHQAQLFTPESALIACKSLSGDSNTIEFVTSKLADFSKNVTLRVMDTQGNFNSWHFPVDITHLLPSSRVVSIPDVNLATAIHQTLGLTRNSTITRLDMLKLTRLVARERNIVDLTGLEHALNLRVLDLWYNEHISDITPLKGLTQLWRLILWGNQISDLTPIANMKGLLYLYLSNNPISDLTPIAGLTQLQVLKLGGLRLSASDLNVVGNFKQLQHITLWGNQISDLTPIKGLTQLKALYLQDNRIRDISMLANFKQLQVLFLINNQISDITPLAELTNLRQLHLRRNWISDLTPLAALTNLNALHIDKNQISDVRPLAELVNLNVLHLEENPIKNRGPLLTLLRKNSDIKIYLKRREPLPVSLSSFRAEHTNAGVILNWTTESELDNAGFYIYRSKTKDGEFKVVNPTMIQGAGTTGERNEYTWTDTTAKPNTVYYYRIEDVSHAGVHKQLATVRLRGLVSAKGKLTTSWADLKVNN